MKASKGEKRNRREESGDDDKDDGQHDLKLQKTDPQAALIAENFKLKARDAKREKEAAELKEGRYYTTIGDLWETDGRMRFKDVNETNEIARTEKGPKNLLHVGRDKDKYDPYAAQFRVKITRTLIYNRLLRLLKLSPLVVPKLRRTSRSFFASDIDRVAWLHEQKLILE